MSDWKEKLRNRTQQAVSNKDSRGLGRRSVLDLSLIKLPLWTPRSGKDKNYIDVMPWRVTQAWYKNLRTRSGDMTKLDIGDVDYKLEVARHSWVGPGKDVMLCLREAFAKTDSICEDMFAEYQKRKDGSREFNEKKAKSFQPSWRDFYIIYDYDASDKGFQLWEISYELFEKYLLDEMRICIDEGGLIIPWDLLDGRSIEFKGREKKIGDTPFIEAEGIAFYRRDPYDEDILDKLPSLDQALVIPTYEQIRAAHYGLEEGDQGLVAEQEKAEAQAETPIEGRSRVRLGEKEAPAPETSSLKEECPAGGNFGLDCNRIKACRDEACSQEVYEACLKKYDEVSKHPLPDEPGDESKSTRTRTRGKGTGTESSSPASTPSKRTRRR